MVMLDKKGCPFEVRSYASEDHPHLIEMYDNFTPKASFQGMPPAVSHVRQKWIDSLIDVGENFLAWQEGIVIGHVVILPDFDKNDAEYLIFVSQSCRGLGVGKALTLSAIQKAKDMGVRMVWLTVDSYNFKGIGLYKHVGFNIRKELSSATERVMELVLEDWRLAVS